MRADLTFLLRRKAVEELIRSPSQYKVKSARRLHERLNIVNFASEIKNALCIALFILNKSRGDG